MADEPPRGDKAVFAFFELIALAFAFEGTSALLNGKGWAIIGGAYAATIVFFVAGVKWPWLKAIPKKEPIIWLAAGAVSGIILGVTGTRLAIQVFRRQPPVVTVERQTGPDRPLIKGWGAPTGSDMCGEVIDGDQLIPWSDKYNVAFLCGFADSTVDREEDDKITVSSAFSIRPGDIRMSAHFSSCNVWKEKRTA